jgi:hypothetical protein
MPRGVHEIAYGGGAQDLVHIPPSRVTSATVFVEDLTEPDDGAERFIVASGAATVDSYSATLTADAGAGEADPRLMTHADDAATVGTTYAVEAADGRTELFVADAASATTIRAKAALSGAYASSSTVRGVQLSVEFPAADANDEDLFEDNPPIRVTWIYTCQGQLHRVSELVRLVRNKSSQRNLGEVETALRQRWPELVKSIAPHGNALREHVRGQADRLDARLRGKGLDSEQLLAGVAGFELLLQRCVLHFAESGHHPATRDPQMFVEEQSREFARLWEHLTIGHSSIGAADVERLSDTAPAGNSKKARSPFVRG